jgi:hypothetical protein
MLDESTLERPGAKDAGRVRAPAGPASDAGDAASTTDEALDLRAAVRCGIRRGVRLHPVPHLDMCLVSAPGDGDLHTIGLPAWRLLELCALRDLAQVRVIFLRTCALRGAAARMHFERTLYGLVRLGLVDVGLQQADMRGSKADREPA